MNITKQRLKQIIKEELEAIKEQGVDVEEDDWYEEWLRSLDVEPLKRLEGSD